MKHRLTLLEDKLLLLTLVAFFYAYSSPVRVAIRAALEGQSFSWGYASGIGPSGKAAMAWGKGLLGHTDYILFLAFAVVWIIWCGLRKPDVFFRVALAGWTSIGFGVGVWLSIGLGDGLTSNKDTLGLASMSYFWTELFPAAIAWLLATILLLKGSRLDGQDRVPWSGLNTWLSGGAAGAIAAAALLLAAGEQDGFADFAGIGLIYIGLMLFFLGIAPWREARASQPARLASA